MVGFKATAFVLAATAVSFAAAQDWSITTLDAAQALPLAGSLEQIAAVEIPDGGLEDCADLCSNIADCLGFVYDEEFGPNLGYCVTLRYAPVGFTVIAPGYDWVGWRYNAPLGPTCSSETDVFEGINGQCVCDATTEVQDTPFGCRALAVASQVVRRKRDRIMPGQARRSAF